MDLKDRAVIQISTKVLADAERICVDDAFALAESKRIWPWCSDYKWPQLRATSLKILAEAAKQGLTSAEPYRIIGEDAEYVGVWAMSIKGKCQKFHIAQQ